MGPETHSGQPPVRASEDGFHAHRSPVYATGGMVATSQPAAVLAGVQVLASGGNAVDAAVAAAAVLAVTEPTSCGLGGDCFALHHDAATGAVTALNGSGRAPAALDLDLLRRQGMDALPRFHAHTVTVPGAVAGWCDLLARFGSRDLGTLLQPAIRLAADGFAVAPKTAHFWARAVAPQLLPHASSLLVDGRRAPRPGERFRNPDLARTLERIAAQGAPGFYQGAVAEAVAAAVRAGGGVMTAGDLAGHRSTWETPISTVYRGKRIHECPPNGQGLAALIALQVLDALGRAHDLGEPLSARRLHWLVEALRLAFEDARRHVADPAFARVPVDMLLSPDRALDRARALDPARARVDPTRGSPHAGSDTVYLAVVDGRGNACSFIQSNYMGFGTGITPAGAGFTLQNRGMGFSLDPAHPNALAPGKRPYHTIIPALATEAEGPDAGALYACFGVMGGFMQPQGHVQVLLALLDDGLDPQAALDRPRVCLEPAEQGGGVALEEGIPEPVVARLAAMGHPVRVVCGHDRALFGRGQIILRDRQRGVLCGGSDLRGDGCALGVG